MTANEPRAHHCNSQIDGRCKRIYIYSLRREYRDCNQRFPWYFADLTNEPAKIIGIAIGVALICLLIILGGIALQKHIRRQRIKKQETTPPKDFTNPVQISGDTPV